jgi:glycosyltransferase involved in cell wall biosynthesis
MSGANGVCFLFDDFHPVFSGHSIYMQQIMARLQDRGRRIYVICWNPGHLPDQEEYRGIHIIRLRGKPYSRGAYLLIFRALWGLRQQYHCLHINGFPDPYGLFVAFSKVFGKRIVLQSTLYGSDDGLSYCQHHRGGSLRVRQLAMVDAITAISQPLVETFVAIGFPVGKIVYIPQGVDLQRFRPVDLLAKREHRRAIGHADGGPIVLFVGTILKRKGVDLLLDAWAAVHERLPQAQLVLVGMAEYDATHDNQRELNEYAEAMRRQAAAYGASVTFAGLQEDIVKWYQAADLFVLPSRKEGFGNVIIEAMACGLPVIVTPMDGVANETVENGRNGFIIEDVAELSQKIIHLLANPEEAAEMGARGQAIASEEFNLDVIAGEYDRLYFGP